MNNDAACRVEMFSGLRLSGAGGSDASVSGGRSGALLALLAYHRPQALRRESLLELLWPDCDPEAGRNRLRVALSGLRKRLAQSGCESFLTSDRFHVTLAPQVATDVADFQEELRRAGECEIANRDATSHWRRAVELYRGALLPDFYDDWIAPEAARLENDFFGALHRLIETLKNDDAAAALHFARRGLVFDPLREALHRDVMALHAATGDINAARRQLQSLEALLHREENAAPDAATRALWQRIERGELTPPQPAASTRAQKSAANSSAAPDEKTMSRLPAQWTRFFGRRAELRELHDALHDDTVRCLSITGAGGSGKTRLALEAARDWETRGSALALLRADGLHDATFLLEAIAATLGVAPVAGGAAPASTPDAALIAAIARRAKTPFLLLLDNFEHLAETGAPRLQTLLASAPQLRVLATSRRRLYLEGERELALSPLAFPKAPPRDVDAARRYESVQLFEDRARVAQPNFRLTAGNVAVVARLCAQLDGLPLALELAAARADVLTPTQIAAFFAMTLDAETEKIARAASSENREYSPDETRRHRTLHAALDWSYQLLAPEAQRFFARLGVFRGSFDEAACERVCDETNAVPLLTQLRAGSLLSTHDGAATMRFRLLETLRVLALEHLSPDERDALARRHAAYFLELAESVSPHLARRDDHFWLDGLEADHDNFRAALAWSLPREKEAEWALQLAVALADFWDVRSHNAEGNRWLERALEAAPQAAPLLRARAQEASARLAMRTQNYTLATTRAAQAETVLRALGEHATLARALCTSGLMSLVHGEFERTRGLYHEALTLAREAGDQPFISYLLNASLQLMASLGDVHAARPLAEESLQLARQGGASASLLESLVTMSQVLQELGENEEARRVLDEAMPLAEAAGPTWDHSRALWIAGNLESQRDGGDIVKMRDFFAASLAILLLDMNDPMPVAIVLNDCAMNLADKAYVESAVVLAGAARAVREAHRLPVLPLHAARYEKFLEAARATLGDENYQAAQRRGAALSPLESVRFLQQLAL